MSFMEQLKDGLSKTRKNFTERMEELVGASVELDDDFMDEMEMILVAGDVGIKTTEKIMAALRKAAATRQIKSPAEALPFLKNYIADMLKTTGPRMRFKGHPSIVLVVGVNGVGKTTTIGKLSNYYRLMGYKVMMCAADTFRAGATEQLQIWGKKAQVDVIAHGDGADPAAVVYDGVQAAIARKADVLFVDTAGRLHNKTNLMKELDKIYRVIRKEIPDGPHETLLVLDYWPECHHPGQDLPGNRPCDRCGAHHAGRHRQRGRGGRHQGRTGAGCEMDRHWGRDDGFPAFRSPAVCGSIV